MIFYHISVNKSTGLHMHPKTGEYGSLFWIFLIFQDIPGLAVQHFADCIQRAEPDGFYFSGFEIGKIDIGDTDLCGKVVQAHFPVCQNSIQTNHDHNV